MLGTIAVTLLMGIIVLANKTGCRRRRSRKQLSGAPPGYHQKTLVAQLAQAVFGSFHLGLLLIAAVTALILVLAANTAFNGFPVLGSVLAQRSYLPHQLHTRGDPWAFSNGIVSLSVSALAAIIAFRAQVTALIQLHTRGDGVFMSFTLNQIGMVRRWTRLLRAETDPVVRRRMMRSRVVTTIGFLSTGAVLLVVLVTKFVAGACIAVVAMTSLFIVTKLTESTMRRLVGNWKVRAPG